MNTSNIRRIQNEAKKINTDKSTYSDLFIVNMVDDNIYTWIAEIRGPIKSIYENYKFKLEIELPNDYPYSAPKVKFITPIQHMNVNDKGDICLNILKKEGWSVALNIFSILLSIIILLDQPNSDDPFNSDLAGLFRSNYEDYINKIKSHCDKYADKW
ncbi:hypothetical protein QLL95_gp1044 [Cotonvirus japonicus]|uniref:E2 ubiquitin-conjugating enzyme n=1 Tax=Cotonvirus japonicus TaxID=2811091 RepID=A0ABM7NSF4_9VIRU|nr:hypothetical protein QLL95_gp1044 [Cotonvirus japonicus]BCS83079.1 hypothetical protein [Cotonvirus japonicus]